MSVSDIIRILTKFLRFSSDIVGNCRDKKLQIFNSVSTFKTGRMKNTKFVIERMRSIKNAYM